MANRMKKPVIVFQDYEYKYKVQKDATLKEINLQIYEGERVIIAGASGCGKSSLAHCINGLNPFCYAGTYRGSLKLLGKEAGELGIFERSHYVGTVLQDTDGQFIGMTVLEDIAFAMENDLVEYRQLEERSRKEAAGVGLLDKLEASPHDLSGGQKQRVSLAGVLVNKAPILLFDEPLANLDPATGKEAMELIDSIQKKTNTTVIIIEHRLEDALYKGADRIILMDEGRIIADTSPQELLCAGLLQKAGIRESLFVTALRYSGIFLKKDMGLVKVEELKLGEEEKQKVCCWFHEEEKEQARPYTKALLEAKNLSFGYSPERENLRNISFTIYEGEMTAVVGKNGAGKSTLAKLLCGFENPERGEIYFRGEEISHWGIRKRAAHIGYVMQNPNQMISKSKVFEEVAFSLQLMGRTEEEIREKVHKVLKVCGLYEFRNWPISALSYGQKKRVTIADILVRDPEIIILDEPTAGQDFRHYTEMMEFLVSLNRKGITVLLITHDMHLMLEYTNRCLVFSEGRLLKDTAPWHLFAEAELLQEASLKETSLFSLAKLCNLPPEKFIERFILEERRKREESIP